MNVSTERLESMSPRGFLRLVRQEDGDIILTAWESDGNDGWKAIASVEFCTPFSGGGGSRETYFALIQLMAAMAADNLDASQNGRRPPKIDDDEQRKIVEWGRSYNDAVRELAERDIRRDAGGGGR